MGDLYYGAARTRVRLDDRILFHLVAVVTSKLRRGESFLVSWHDSESIGDGRSSVWMHPNVDLHYKFDGGRPAQIDRDLMERMLAGANSAHGLELSEASLVSRT